MRESRRVGKIGADADHASRAADASKTLARTHKTSSWPQRKDLLGAAFVAEHGCGTRIADMVHLAWTWI
jgi:hypothetical protein